MIESLSDSAALSQEEVYLCLCLLSSFSPIVRSTYFSGGLLVLLLLVDGRFSNLSMVNMMRGFCPYSLVSEGYTKLSSKSAVTFICLSH